MKLLTRNEAIETRQSLYFTGVACRRGHISPRYTKNGSCKECLHPVFISVQSKSNQRKQDIHSGMAIRKFRVKLADLDNFKMILWGTAMLRRKEFELADIETKRLVKSGAGGIDVYLHSFWIFLEDEPYLRGLEVENLKPPAAAAESEGARLYRLNMEAIYGPDWRSLPPEPIKAAK